MNKRISENYWSEALSKRHEHYHINDWRPRYKKQVRKKEVVIETITNAVTLKNLTYKKAYNEKENAIFQHLLAGFLDAVIDYKGSAEGVEHEKRAYRDGAPRYITLRNLILAKRKSL